MARRRRTGTGIESFEDLARKLEILERELAVQREALEKLKQMGSAPKAAPEAVAPLRRKSA